MSYSERLLTLPHPSGREPGLGSQAIRNESYGLETYSPYQKKDLTDFKIFDSGDLELPIGDTARVLYQY